MTTTPNDVQSSTGLRDVHGRRQFVVKSVGQALVPGDVKEAGSITDIDGREHVILLDSFGNPITGGGGGAGSTFAGVGDLVADYSAVGDASTDNTVAIQTALNDLKSGAISTLYVPPGDFNYKYLVAENTYGWEMVGAGPNQQFQTGPSRLRTTGTGDIRVTFQGTLAATNLAMMTINTASLTGHAALTGRGYVRGYHDGSAGINEAQQVTILAMGGTYTLTFLGQTTTALAYDASPATVQAALEALSSIGAGNVSCAYAGGFGLVVARSSNFTLSGIGFDYAGSFAGFPLVIDGQFNGTEDCQDFTIERCGTKDFGGSTSAAGGIRLSRGIIGTIERCHWAGAKTGIVLGDPNGQFVNNLVIEKCTFNGQTDCQILLGSNDLEAITVRDCCFEAGTNVTAIRGATGPIDGGQHQTYNMMIENNWFGDSAGNQKWLDNLSTQSNSYFGTIAKNRFAGVGAAGVHLKLNGKWVVYGNTFEGGTLFRSDDPTHCGIVSFANHYNVTTVWDPTDFPNGLPDTCTEFGNTTRTGFASSAPMYVGSGAVDTSVRSTLILAGTDVAPGTVSKSMVFHGTVPATTTKRVAVQAPWNGSGGAGQLLAGATPEAVVWWQDKQLGLFGVSPVSQPASTGTATGFTAGAGTAVTDQSTFTGNVGLTAPAGFSATAVASGGTFAAGTYFWQVSATNAAGETIPSTERSATIVLNGSCTLVWNRVPGATGYKVYRATVAGQENVSPALVATIGSGTTLTYTDTGTAVGAGATLAASTALTAYRISDIVKALKQLGALAG